MKKLLTISFAAFYLLTAVGVTVSVHKCMGQIASIKLFVEAGGCCCSKDKAMNDCCEDESVFVQLDDDQRIIKSLRISDDLQPELNVVPSIQLTSIKVKKNEVRIESQNLPPPLKQPIWLLNCNFTFYG
ncbi:MAG: hypothetical protein AAF502_11330 [Bacteroidota bacterium]